MHLPASVEVSLTVEGAQDAQNESRKQVSEKGPTHDEKIAHGASSMGFYDFDPLRLSCETRTCISDSETRTCIRPVTCKGSSVGPSIARSNTKADRQVTSFPSSVERPCRTAACVVCVAVSIKEGESRLGDGHAFEEGRPGTGTAT